MNSLCLKFRYNTKEVEIFFELIQKKVIFDYLFRLIDSAVRCEWSEIEMDDHFQQNKWIPNELWKNPMKQLVDTPENKKKLVCQEKNE